MVARFKGVMYMLTPLNHSRFIGPKIGQLDHQGSVSSHDLFNCSTPQVYLDKDKEGNRTLYAATVMGNSQHVNFVGIMTPVPANVPRYYMPI